MKYSQLLFFSIFIIIVSAFIFYYYDIEPHIKLIKDLKSQVINLKKQLSSLQQKMNKNMPLHTIPSKTMQLKLLDNISKQVIMHDLLIKEININNNWRLNSGIIPAQVFLTIHGDFSKLMDFFYETLKLSEYYWIENFSLQTGENDIDLKMHIILLKLPSHSYFRSLPKIKQNKNKSTINFKQMNLKEAIYQMARYLKINVILSPQIQGETTFYVQEVASLPAFEVLLKSHGLTKWQLGNIWFISTYEELIKQQQEETKWQTLQEDSLPLITQTWQLNFAQAKDILLILKDSEHRFLSKRGYVNMDGRTNRIIIIDTKERLLAIKNLLKKLDIPIKQVLIQVRLINIDESKERELGLDFRISGEFSLAKMTNQTLLDVKLAAMERQGSAELISNPILFTGNQQLASIEAGEEVPYQEISESGGTAVSFKKAVLALRVKPQILPNNQILLQLQINQDRPNARIVQGVPSISTEQITSHVLVKNGQTIVLGGIYETNFTEDQKQLPFVKEIPILSSFIKYKSTRQNKRKLLIFVTPSVITYENEST